MSPGSAPRPWAGPADAFAFLSRVAPASRAGGLDRALAWFGPVGLVFGVAWTLAAMGAARMAAANPAAPGPWAQGMLAGWVWLLLSVWTTRGLHWDGLADLGDAEGSGARGGRFHQILRDSRLGAFGALRLLLVFGGQWLAVSWHGALVFSGAGAVWAQALPLALAPAWGRGVAVLLAHAVPARDAASLGGMACAGASPRLRAGYLAAGAAAAGLPVLLGLPLWRGLLLLAAQSFLLRRVAAVARREGGLSGDFFGAAIEEGTLCFLLLTL